MTMAPPAIWQSSYSQMARASRGGVHGGSACRGTLGPTRCGQCRDEAIDRVDRVLAELPVPPVTFEQREERLDVLDPLEGPGFEVVGPHGARGGRARAGGHGAVGGGGKQEANDGPIAPGEARRGGHG